MLNDSIINSNSFSTISKPRYKYTSMNNLYEYTTFRLSLYDLRRMGCIRFKYMGRKQKDFQHNSIICNYNYRIYSFKNKQNIHKLREETL